MPAPHERKRGRFGWRTAASAVGNAFWPCTASAPRLALRAVVLSRRAVLRGGRAAHTTELVSSMSPSTSTVLSLARGAT
eukprot:1889028-Prymnesium_polylepis.1